MTQPVKMIKTMKQALENNFFFNKKKKLNALKYLYKLANIRKEINLISCIFISWPSTCGFSHIHKD